MEASRPIPLIYVLTLLIFCFYQGSLPVFRFYHTFFTSIYDCSRLCTGSKPLNTDLSTSTARLKVMTYGRT